MNTIPFAKDLYLYTGSTFDGSIVIKDVHGEPFLISEGDEISFVIKKADKTSADEPIQITITYEDEVNGEYPFKLSPVETSSLNGDYYYSAFIRFTDGDYYQIVPDTLLKASVPYDVLSYYENKNQIIAQVPRAMVESNYVPALNEIEEFVSSVDSKDNKLPIRIRHIYGADIIMISNNIDISNITPYELIEQINGKIEYFGTENPYISGFFHVDEIPEHNEYYMAVKETFEKKFIDVEALLKTPILSKHSEQIISSVAFDMLRERPTHNDILLIAHNEYPERIIQDETHFNKKGCQAVARVILKEVYNIG